MTILTKILSSKVRAELFRILFDVQARELYMRELEREVGCTIGPIQTELKKLRELELVLSRRSGNRLYYRANPDHPLYSDICSMVLKTSGLAPHLRTLFESRDDIIFAFIFGSIASDNQRATSDLDLMIVGDISLRILSGLLAELRKKLGREINPHVLKLTEFTERRRDGEHFISSVLGASKIFVKGSEDDFAKLD